MAARFLSHQRVFGRPVQVCLLHHPDEAMEHECEAGHDLLLVDGQWAVESLLALPPRNPDALALLMLPEGEHDKAQLAKAGGYDDHLVQDRHGAWLERLPQTIEDAVKRVRLQRSLDDDTRARQQRREAQRLALQRSELLRRRQDRLLSALTTAQSRFIANAKPHQVLGGVLKELLRATESEHGLVAEVQEGEGPHPHIKMQAMADRSGRGLSKAQRAWVQSVLQALDDPRSPIGAVVRTARPVVLNQPVPDPRPSPTGLPEGERPLDSCLGLPVVLDDRVVGVLVLANKPGGYAPDDAEQLAPLLGALAHMAVAWRAQAARAKAERSLQLTLSHINQGLLCVNRHGQVEFCNDRMETLLELPAGTLAGQPHIRQLEAQGAILGPDAPGTFWLKSAAQRTIEIQVQVLADGASVRTYTDVTDYVQVQQALQAGEQSHREMADQLKTILEAIPDLLYEFDTQGRYLYIGKGQPELLNAPPDTLVHATYHDVLPPEAAAEIDAAMAEASICGSSLGHQYRLELPDGTHWYELSMTRREPQPGQPPRFVMLARDITQRRLIDERIQHLAFHDALTNLPNRRLLQDRLAKALKSAKRQQQHGALLFIDLDNFKDLNDTLGHDQGDELLQLVAVRLRGCVRDVDTVARLGGDEFLVMIEGLSGVAATAAIEADKVARKVLATLRQPYDLSSCGHSSTPSIGVALFGQPQDTVEDLLKRADLAMYRAKIDGRNTISFFDPEMQASALRRAALESDLRTALREEQWRLYFQPVVDAFGHVLGAEALVRWNHPVRGMVPPGAFIPLAEQSGMILGLGQWVLRRACECLAEWARDPQLRHWTLSVNVSTREFREAGYVEQVKAEVQRAGVPPHRLKLEVTESMFMHDAEGTAAKMEVLRDFGIRFALDDFGTGYSSLSYLKRLPLDEIKIDQSFVRDVLEDEDDAAIVRAILTLAETLGLSVVAEGVELSEQHDFLAGHGCRAFQGYLFGRPACVSEAPSYARTRPVSRALLGH